ncbi:MAG: hypothetical protein IT480_13770 [Gammaproteobacteria bacterium]|nr:hypothetical protein [Gammaproteobacteria bacterium]
MVGSRKRRWHMVAAVMVLAVALAIAGFRHDGGNASGKPGLVEVGGRWVGSGVVPTRTEASSASPRIFRPQQAGKLASSTSRPVLQAYSVSVGADASTGTAVLGAAPDTARTYVLGAILENGAVFTEVRADHVVLELGGQLHTLYTVGSEGSLTAQGDAAVEKSALNSGAPTPVQPPPAPAARLEDMVRYAPLRGAEGIDGLALYPGVQGSYFEQWGLKRGDVLVSLSDVSSGDIHGLIERLGDLTEGQSLLARVRRGSKEMQVLLEGRSRR